MKTRNRQWNYRAENATINYRGEGITMKSSRKAALPNSAVYSNDRIGIEVNSRIYKTTIRSILKHRTNLFETSKINRF